MRRGPTAPPAGLRRQLGLAPLTAAVIGEVIGVGIFLTPASMARSLGSPLWLLVVWLVMGTMALSGALCYGELAARFPEVGGGYVFLRRAFGPAVAFLYGWQCLLVMDPGITAALATGLASYVAYLFHLSAAGVKLVAIAVIVTLAAVSAAGARTAGRVMEGLTTLKIVALVVLALTALVLERGHWSNFFPLVRQHTGSAPLPGAFAPALLGAFFAFGGWWEISKLAGEAADPARTMPRALAFGIAAVTGLYILTSAVFLYLVPLEQVSSGEAFAAQAGAALFGRAGADVFSLIVIVAVLGSLMALLMALPRAYFAMAQDGVFFRRIAAVHPTFGTPGRAIALQATLACVLVAVGTFQEIVAYFVFIAVAFVGLTVAGLFVLRRAPADTAYRTPGYPLTPVVFLALVALLLALIAGHDRVQAALGTGVVALGVPVYYVMFRRRLAGERKADA